MIRYTLYVNFKENIVEYPLPAVDNRRVVLNVNDSADPCSIHFEVFDGEWTICSSNATVFEVNGTKTDRHIISDGDVIKATLNDGKVFVIMVYALTPFITEFKKFNISGRTEISIGNREGNDILIPDRFISNNHASIVFENNQWTLIDKSLNGTYINGRRINGSIKLNVFDIIYTVGLKIVFLGNYIAINRSDIVGCRLEESELTADEINSEYSTELFSRSPRIVEPLFNETIEIEAPPAPQRQRSQPLIFVVGPSVTMPIPILMSTFINSQLNSSSSRGYLATIASVGMSALMGAGWAIAHYIYNKRTSAKDEKFRIESYKQYIDKNENLLREKHNYNNSILLNQYLSSSDIISGFMSDSRFIWNRNMYHSDFLTVRLGIGIVKFSGDISTPKQRFSLYKDDMSEMPHELKEKYEYMHNTVSLLNLRKHKIIGIIGSRESMNKAAANIAVQLSGLHCYTDVRIAAFFAENEYRDYGWMRWLPHINSDDMRIRMIADDAQSYQNVLYHLNDVLRTRFESINENQDEAKSTPMPHYVVFCTSESIFDGDSIEKYMSVREELGFTFILLYGQMDKLPNECKLIIQSDGDDAGIYELENHRSELNHVNFDLMGYEYAEKFARSLSTLRVREFSSGEIPNSIEYFNMIGIGKLEQWELMKKYKENRVYEGIRSFIGVGIGGKPIFLDIHEKKYGPHGLVAGTTGSGKSEALQTFIISLALNYHPDEVAFILIDYKGGGMANAFIGMPHIAGTITNLGGEGNESEELDANLTRRALVSIKSEIKHRQAVFNNYKVNHIDMYIRMYREKKVNEPLPHLIIISDEFAELKKEQPEFIKELVSTARVGRSLGIHLILATQKPAGVVDDEIWSNSRFKLCLRVQDKQDSIGMLKRPEAAYLTQAGRAYLQIGNDEIFEQFQAGYSGAAYNPKESAGVDSESDFAMINIDGTPSVVRHRDESAKSGKLSQLEAAAKYISKVCADNHIDPTRALWLPVIPNNITAEDVADEIDTLNGISAAVGFADDPEKQRQFPICVDFSKCSNMIIVGNSGMGKSTMLLTILTSLIKSYSCDKVNFYILDFSSRILKLFKSSPHCGLVAFSDEKEAVERLFKFIEDEMERRKHIFNDANVGSFSEYSRVSEIPLILVIIDNYFSFSELYTDLQDSFLHITRDSAKYGIQVIITLTHLNDIRYKLKQNFLDTLTLAMSEKSDYREALGKTPDFMPKNTKGRGLIERDGRILEYQTFLPSRGDSEIERNKEISRLIQEAAKRDEGVKNAKTVTVLPSEQEYSEFYNAFRSENKLPLGYVKKDISVYSLDLKNTYCYAVSDSGNKGLEIVLGNFMYAAREMGGYIYQVKLDPNIRVDGDADTVISDKSGIRDMLIALKDEFNKRGADKKNFLEKKTGGDFSEYLCGKYQKIFVIIDSMNAFLNAVYDSSNEEDMHTLTEKIFDRDAVLGFRGIYFIAGFDSSAYGNNFYTSACKCFTAYKKGIHLGGRFDKQKLFDVNLPIMQISKPLDGFIGYTMDGGNEYILHIPHSERR